jgi:hypothetical protein
MKVQVGRNCAALGLLACLMAPAVSLPADSPRVGITPLQAYVAPPGNEDLIVEIRRADGETLSGTATIRLTTRQAAQAEVVAAPQQRHRARFSKVPLGPIRLQVLSEGFATADLRLLLEHANRELRVTIYLRQPAGAESGSDEALPALSAAASSNYAKILDSLRKGNLKESRHHYAKLRRSALGHPHVQYLAGVVDYKSKDTGMALFHFSQAAYLNAGFEDSAHALGALLYHTGIFSDAYLVFRGLAEKHPDEWAPAWEAASAAFRAARYPEAREHALSASKAGSQLAPKAELLLALTDALLNKWSEAYQAANASLAHTSDAALTATAKDLLTAVGPPDAASDDRRHALAPERAEAALLAAEFDPRLPPRMWAPPDVDDAAPVLAQGESSCNSAEILQSAGQRVQVRFAELSDVAATERIEQAVVDATGRVKPLHHFTVDYIADVHPLPNNHYAVDEFQGGVLPEPSSTSPPVAHGLAAMALVFYPPMQSDFAFKCEGLTQWNSRPAWSIYFTQRKDLPARLYAYNQSGTFYPAYLRGRGIVDQQSGELLHIETDLQDPIPEVRLEEEHLVVDYKPVTFKSLSQPAYLPATAELYTHLRGHLYRVRHSFEKYLRFSVKTKQDMRTPQPPPPEPEQEPTPESKPDAKPKP